MVALHFQQFIATFQSPPWLCKYLHGNLWGGKRRKQSLKKIKVLSFWDKWQESIFVVPLDGPIVPCRHITPTGDNPLYTKQEKFTFNCIQNYFHVSDFQLSPFTFQAFNFHTLNIGVSQCEVHIEYVQLSDSFIWINLTDYCEWQWAHIINSKSSDAHLLLIKS